MNGKKAITADRALRLSTFFGLSKEFWRGLQSDFGLEKQGKFSMRKSSGSNRRQHAEKKSRSRRNTIPEMIRKTGRNKRSPGVGYQCPALPARASDLRRAGGSGVGNRGTIGPFSSGRTAQDGQDRTRNRPPKKKTGGRSCFRRNSARPAYPVGTAYMDFSTSRILRVVLMTVSGLREIDSIPIRTRASAISGKSLGACPQMPEWTPFRFVPSTASRMKA